jgi:hypothetical protein
MTEAEVLDVLALRYGQRSGNGPAWAFVPHVRNGAGWGGSTGYGGLRTCNALALSMYTSTGFALIGHEVKVSRSDWLRELKDPSKAGAFRRYCERWWLVAPDGVADPGEMPAGWGLLVVKNGRARQRVAAPKLEAEPLPRGMVVALTRAAIRGGRLGGEDRGLPLEIAA